LASNERANASKTRAEHIFSESQSPRRLQWMLLDHRPCPVNETRRARTLHARGRLKARSKCLQSSDGGAFRVDLIGQTQQPPNSHHGEYRWGGHEFPLIGALVHMHSRSSSDVGGNPDPRQYSFGRFFMVSGACAESALPCSRLPPFDRAVYFALTRDEAPPRTTLHYASRRSEVLESAICRQCVS